MYPRHRYHPDKESVLVTSQEEDEALGEGWVDSPARYGVETCPGVTPDPAIAANKKQLSSKVESTDYPSDRAASPPAQESKRVNRRGKA